MIAQMGDRCLGNCLECDKFVQRCHRDVMER
jgi:hypothetical protein